MRNGIESENILPYHICTKEELDEFPQPVPDSVSLLEEYKKASPTRHLFCLDWDKFGDDLAIWGTAYNEFSYQTFEYYFLPCNYLHAEFGPTDDSIADECISDHEQQIKYLGNMSMVFLSTTQVFNQQNFEEGTIVEARSRIFHRQIDQTKPTWLDGKLTVSQLEDEIEYLQYG